MVWGQSLDLPMQLQRVLSPYEAFVTWQRFCSTWFPPPVLTSFLTCPCVFEEHKISLLQWCSTWNVLHFMPECVCLQASSGVCPKDLFSTRYWHIYKHVICHRFNWLTQAIMLGAPSATRFLTLLLIPHSAISCSLASARWTAVWLWGNFLIPKRTMDKDISVI